MHQAIQTALELLAIDFPQFKDHLLCGNYDLASTGASAASVVAFSTNDLEAYKRTTAIAAACVYADQGDIKRALKTLPL